MLVDDVDDLDDESGNAGVGTEHLDEWLAQINPTRQHWTGKTNPGAGDQAALTPTALLQAAQLIPPTSPDSNFFQMELGVGGDL